MYGTLCFTVHSTACSSGSFWLMSTPMRSNSFGTIDSRPEGGGDGDERERKQHRGNRPRHEDGRVGMRKGERLTQRRLEKRPEHEPEDHRRHRPVVALHEPAEHAETGEQPAVLHAVRLRIDPGDAEREDWRVEPAVRDLE